MTSALDKALLLCCRPNPQAPKPPADQPTPGPPPRPSFPAASARSLHLTSRSDFSSRQHEEEMRTRHATWLEQEAVCTLADKQRSSLSPLNANHVQGRVLDVSWGMTRGTLDMDNHYPQQSRCWYWHCNYIRKTTCIHSLTHSHTHSLTHKQPSQAFRAYIFIQSTRAAIR